MEIKGFPDYELIEGKIFNKRLGTWLTGTINGSGYRFYRLKNSNGVYKSTGEHRVVMLAHKPIDNPDDYVVNHLDGDKLNNDPSNLEWCTYQENSEHAGREGLSSKCIPILVKDTTTGAITEYPSYRKCALDLGISKDIVAHRVEDPSMVYEDLKQYRKKSDTGPWRIDITKLPSKYNRKSVLCLDILTMTEKIFDSATDFSKFIGLGVPYVVTRLKNEVHPLFNLRYQIKNYNDKSPWRTVTDRFAEYEKTTGKRVAFATDVNGKIIKYYLSSVLLARELNFSASYVNNKLNNGELIHNHITYSYRSA